MINVQIIFNHPQNHTEKTLLSRRHGNHEVLHLLHIGSTAACLFQLSVHKMPLFSLDSMGNVQIIFGHLLI